jgi:hypothetical protein
MTATADVFTFVMCFAGGSAISYFAGWLFSEAISDMERFAGFLRRFVSGE